MSIREVPMFKVVCDGCGVTAEEHTDWWAWSDRDQATDVARDAGWLTGHAVGSLSLDFCPDCTTWGREADEQAPRPEAIAKALAVAEGVTA